MPMPPITMRSLGGTFPSRPSTELGIKLGSAAALAAIAARVRNRRRVRVIELSLLMSTLPVPPRPRQGSFWEGGHAPGVECPSVRTAEVELELASPAG